MPRVSSRARRGATALPDGTLRLQLEGSAGQSFGAFAVAGMHLALCGEANDGVGKGMSGGEITIAPFAGPAAADAVLVGNAALYGATGGALFVAGRAGERFAVRNSGALAVVEGTGDHACEYMTGGAAVILGETGRNLGAGMTGGVAFVLDVADTLGARVNGALVAMALPEAQELTWLRALLRRHLVATGSRRAQALLDDWGRAAAAFRRVAPREGRFALPWPAEVPARRWFDAPATAS